MSVSGRDLDKSLLRLVRSEESEKEPLLNLLLMEVFGL